MIFFFTPRSYTHRERESPFIRLLFFFFGFVILKITFEKIFISFLNSVLISKRMIIIIRVNVYKRFLFYYTWIFTLNHSDRKQMQHIINNNKKKMKKKRKET